MSERLLSELEISIGENGNVTCRVDNSQSQIVAKALLIEGPIDQPTRIVLDRAIHSSNTTEFKEWFVTGVVSDLIRK
jgi:hypothetical protein